MLIFHSDLVALPRGVKRMFLHAFVYKQSCICFAMALMQVNTFSDVLLSIWHSVPCLCAAALSLQTELAELANLFIILCYTDVIVQQRK